MKLHRIQGTVTPIFAILSKDYRKLQQITRKLRRTKYKTYIKYKNIPTKADPTTYMTLIAIPEGHNEVLNVQRRFGTAVAKNVRESLARRAKAKALSSYRVAFRKAAYTSKILNLAVSKPYAKGTSLINMIPTVSEMRKNLTSKQKPQKPAKNAPLRDAKRLKLMLKIIDDTDIC